MSRSRRQRYELRSAELNQRIGELLDAAEAEFGPGEGRDYVRQMLVSALRMVRDDASAADLKLMNAALKEMRHAFRVFAPYDHVRKVAVFGSARTPQEHPDWQHAHDFAERMVAADWMVITGAGDGIMGAAQGGAGREASFGVNIRLPFEQQANDVIAGDSKLIHFRYFFTRKVSFVKESHAIALFPGGFGTHDEGFEALTLIQTGKSEIVPVVYVDAPGGSYWKDWQRYVQSHLLERKLISDDDMGLFKVTDDLDEAVAEITRFYANYHSSRYVGDRLVVRVRQAPDAASLSELNDDFADIVAKGKIEVCDPLTAEGDEVAHLPRVVLRFDRRSIGRLRQLIDRLNALEGAASGPTRDASPHEILPEALTPEASAEQDQELADD